MISNYLKNFIKRFWKKKSSQSTLCVLPWIHLNIAPNGKVLFCCAPPDFSKSVAGDLKKQRIEEIWNGEFLKSLRKCMINGVKPSVCSVCYDNELVSGYSFRMAHNRDFATKLKEIPRITNKDGSLDKVDLRFWDFRFSNLCNYKCRMCGPESSSAWIPDARKLGWEKYDVPYNIEAIDQNPNIDFLIKYIDTVEFINFAGGEPLLMDEHWQILDMLDKRKRYDVNISYNTNLSILKYKNKNILDYWVKWGKRILISASIDEIGKRAEYIRSGSKWNIVVENLISICNTGVLVKPYITVSAMNVFRIPEIIDNLIDLGVINKNENWRNFELNLVMFEPRFHVSILPDKEREEIIDRLEDYTVDFKNKYQVDISDRFLQLIWHLKKPRNKKNCQDFIEYTRALDKIRNENTYEIIPELKCILDENFD